MWKRCILEIATEAINLGDGIELGVEPENVQNRSIGAERNAHGPVFNASQRRYRHAGPFGDELCRKPAPKSRRTDSAAEPGKPALQRRKQWRYALCHANILALISDKC